MDKSYIFRKLYQKQYKQRKNNKCEYFYIQLDKKAILD